MKEERRKKSSVVATKRQKKQVDCFEFLRSLRIRSGKNFVPFDPFPYQKVLSKIIDEHEGTVLFKPRQIGVTEFVGGKMLHEADADPAFSGVLISMGQDESSKVSSRIQGMPAAISSFEWEYRSTKYLKIKNCGEMAFRPATDKAGRSLPSVTWIVFDEAAFIQNIKEIYAGASPAQEMVGSAARKIFLSTMSEEGKLTWFWDLLDSDNGEERDAEEIITAVREHREHELTNVTFARDPDTGEIIPGMVYWTDENGWAKVIIHWRSHPVFGKDPNYLEKVKRKNKLTEDQLQREHNLGIPAGGGSLFSNAAIKICNDGKWEDNRRAAHYYLLGVDPNFGSTDYFVAQVWDITKLPFSLVAEYRENNQSPTKARKEVCKLIDAYKPVICSIEANAGGSVIAENLYSDRPYQRVELVRHTKFSKLINTDRIALALEQEEVSFPPDWVGIQEMRKFSRAERAATSGHDDCVMAWAVAFAYLEEAIGDRIDFDAWLRSDH